jgi:ribosomal protein L37AE/L43A
MPHVIEPAPTARAKCRGCGAKIDKGELRFGEAAANPFGEGETRYWFHLECGAWRRPEPFLEALAGTTVAIEHRDRLEAEARAGVEHHRLPRLAAVQRDPSGRARCRNCRETIAKGTWRIALQIWEDSRFSPSGFVHAACAAEYFGTPDAGHRIARLAHELSPQDRADLDASL